MEFPTQLRSVEAIGESRPTIVGVPFDFVNADEVLERILGWKERKRGGFVALVNPHSVLTCGRDFEMNDAISSADIVLPDGIGIVVAARLLGLGYQSRLTGPSLMLSLCDYGRKHGLRHFFYGGAEGVAKLLSGKLQRRYPGLEVAGEFCPPFRPLTPEEDAHAIETINATKPDVVWVGLGAPKQEKWIARHRSQLSGSALVGVGAAFDFHAGVVPWAPQWVRRFGVEWAFRLVCEPQRLWRRNLDSPLFLSRVIRQIIFGE